MNDGFTWWLIVLGIAIGVGLVWVFVVRLPRAESDVDAAELPAEAGWISRNIESYGGIAPQPLVEEVLELHRQYLVTGATPLPPTWTPGANDVEPAAEMHDAPVAAHLPTSGAALESDPAAIGQSAHLPTSGAALEPDPAAIGGSAPEPAEPVSEPDAGHPADSDRDQTSSDD